MIPLPELLAEFMVGLGAALFGANLVVLFRTRTAAPAKGRRPPKPPSMTRVYINLMVGAVVALLGLAALTGRG
jgi:hypothetical protein